MAVVLLFSSIGDSLFLEIIDTFFMCKTEEWTEERLKVPAEEMEPPPLALVLFIYSNIYKLMNE